MKIGQTLQGLGRRLCLNLATRAEKTMFMNEHAFYLFRLKGPSEANSACGNTIYIFRAQNSGGGDGDISRAVLKGAQCHLSGNLHAGQIECFDGVSADMKQALLGLRRINHITALNNSPLPSTPDSSVTILQAVQDSAVVSTKE